MIKVIIATDGREIGNSDDISIGKQRLINI